MATYLTLYLVLGLGVFFALRLLFKRARLDSKPHEKIWIIPLWTIEGWIMGPLLWPLLAVLSLFWFAADLLHARGRKEIEQQAELEALRDRRHDRLDLYQKIDLLKAEVEKAKPKAPNQTPSAGVDHL